jgi:hypothetical protein
LKNESHPALIFFVTSNRYLASNKTVPIINSVHKKKAIMKKNFLIALSVFAGISLLLLSSCRLSCIKGSGKEATISRKVGEFTKIDISGTYKVIIKQDSSMGVTITGDDNLLEMVKTEVSGDNLKISTGNKNLCNSGPMSIIIGVHNLAAIKASGAIEINSAGKIVTKNFGLDLSGATKVNMELDAADVSTEGSGVTEITLKGQASSHNINLSGGGKIHAFDFIVGNYNIETSGASDCEINVLHELTVNSSGASSIKYKGNPTSINNKKSGVSSLTKVN